MSKLFLFVPYSQKDKAKELGAKFDGDSKKWYAPKKSNGKHFRSVMYDKLKELFGKKQKSVPYSVPYDDKDKAKILGLFWDPDIEYSCFDYEEQIKIYKQGAWCSYENDKFDIPYEKIETVLEEE